MSLLSLTLPDFKAQLPFSVAIELAQVQPFVQFAYTLELVPLLGYATLEALDALPAFATSAYEPGASVALDAYVMRRERVYRATVASPTTAPGESAEWAYEPLRTLWASYLKAWWVQAAYARFLAQHGLNITKAGVTVPIDRAQGTYDRPSSADKAALLASAESIATALRARLTAFLHAEDAAYHKDPTTGYAYFPAAPACHNPLRATPGTRLRGINSPRRFNGHDSRRRTDF